MARPDFPKTLREFRRRFAEPRACLDYLWESRWPEGFQCPRCEHRKAWRRKARSLYECQGCGYQLSPTAGTVLHRSRFPLQDWFWAAYLMATHTPGLSATQLQRQMNCSYKTAWFLLHRLRRAMVSPDRSRLHGRVEVDETFIGGPAKGKHARGVAAHPNKSLVFGAVEVVEYVDAKGKRRERAGRLRLCKTARADETSIRLFLEANVDPSTIVSTDGWAGYSKSALAGFSHHPSLHLAIHVHRAFSNLKTWLAGTHHGVEPKYLQRYLDEFVFRFNRRNTPMAAFQSLLGIASSIQPCAATKISLPESAG
jgi:transposase-like protein